MGRFRMIFDANGPLGDRIPGRDVPEDFISLPQEYVLLEEDERPPQRLHMDSTRRGGVAVQTPSAVYGSHFLLNIYCERAFFAGHLHQYPAYFNFNHPVPRARY